MSAIGPKQTSAPALHMFAFGGKADMTVCANPLLRSLLGVKRTYRFALHMSAFDPKRTLASALHIRELSHVHRLSSSADGESHALAWRGRQYLDTIARDVGTRSFRRLRGLVLGGSTLQCLALQRECGDRRRCSHAQIESSFFASCPCWWLTFHSGHGYTRPHVPCRARHPRGHQASRSRCPGAGRGVRDRWPRPSR
jgi:hypothetical protein